MGTRLPPWVVDNDVSVRREVEFYRTMTVSERAQHMAAACRGAARMLASRADRERVLAWVDPLPERTKEALKRLRAQARGRSK